MIKKIINFVTLILAFSILMSTVVSADESGTIINMTYENWLVEQEGISESQEILHTDLEPVKTISQKQKPNISKIYTPEKSGKRLLGSILKEKGKYELNGKVNSDLSVENVTPSISQIVNSVNDVDFVSNESSANDTDSVSIENSLSDTLSGNTLNRVNNEDLADGLNVVISADSVNMDNITITALTAGLIPVIVNEDSLVDGQITTDTLIAFLYNDTDGNKIVNRYIDGNVANFILGEIDGGFVMQIIEPATYEMYYQVENGVSEFSKVLGFIINVIEAPIVDDYQVFEGSFTSVSDIATYNFSIDFSTMSSVAVCLVRKGYVGTRMEVFDESGNQVLFNGTGNSQAKKWGYIDKPSSDATECNYTIVVKPNMYENRSSDYRIIIGDKKDTELMMSGIENTVLLDQYYHAEINLQNSDYVPNNGEYWYKYRREPTSVITILSDVTDIRFYILDANTLEVKFDSVIDPSTHKTFPKIGSWICSEKARPNTVVGSEYYLVVYSTKPNSNLSLRTGNMGTAVGHPIMTSNRISISPEITVSLPKSGYSSTIILDIEDDDLPNTAQVKEVTLSGSSLSNVEFWRMQAPNIPYWIDNPSSFWYGVDMNYKDDSSGNARLKGTWNSALKASSSGKGKTFTPRYNFTYSYEYGD